MTTWRPVSLRISWAACSPFSVLRQPIMTFAPKKLKVFKFKMLDYTKVTSGYQTIAHEWRFMIRNPSLVATLMLLDWVSQWGRHPEYLFCSSPKQSLCQCQYFLQWWRPLCREDVRRFHTGHPECRRKGSRRRHPRWRREGIPFQRGREVGCHLRVEIKFIFNLSALHDVNLWGPRRPW